MEIIKLGTDPSKRNYRGSCLNCGTVVQVLQAELKYSDRSTGFSARYVVCPVCGGYIHPNPYPAIAPVL